MRKQRGAEVFHITGARTGLTEDVRARQRRYIISMSIRTVSVILTVVLWNVERPLAWATLVVGALLPYIAVVYANAGRENAPQPHTALVPPRVRRAIAPSRVETGAERHADAVPAPESGEEPDKAAKPEARQVAEPVGDAAEQGR
jgi:hypothetical protein